MSKNSLVILESLDEAKKYVGDLCAKDNDLRTSEILSLNPNIRAYLRKNGFVSMSTSEIIDGSSFNQIMNKCQEMEKWLISHQKKDGVDLPEEYFKNTYFHYLRQLWRHFLFNIELISKLLVRGNYQRIYAFKYPKIYSSSPWIDWAQFYMGDLAERLCVGNSVEFIGMPPPKVQVKNEFREHYNPSIFNKICNRISYLFISISARLMRKRRTILIASPSYNMDLVCNELLAKDRDMKMCLYYVGSNGIIELLRAMVQLCFTVFGKKINRPKSVAKADYALPIMTYACFYEGSYNNAVVKQYLEATLSGIRAMGKVGMYKQVDLKDLLYEKVVTDLIPHMLKIHFQAFGLEKAIEAVNLNYVISQMNFGINGALGYITQKLGIDSVLISHGSHILHQEKIAAREHKILAENLLVGDYKYSAVQSPHAREIALQMVGDPSRVISIKPTLWGRGRIKSAPRSNDYLTLVHAGTLKLRHNRRFIYETSEEYLQGLLDIVRVVSGLDHIRLIIKLRTDIHELWPETLDQYLLRSENVSIERHKPFAEVLSEAQMLVSFSSTTIEESLNNNIPVLLYGGQGRYSHIPVEPYSNDRADLNQAVFFVKNESDLKGYFKRLNDNYRTFRVSADKFKKHCFAEDEVVDLTSWLLGLGSKERCESE